MKLLPPLSSNDLTWLQRILEEDLSGLMGYDSMVLLPPENYSEPPLKQAAITSRTVFDFEQKRIFLPLTYKNQVRALATFNGVLHLDKLSRLGLFFQRIASLSLEKFQLTQSLFLDQVTGLFSRKKILSETSRMILGSRELMDSGAPRMEMDEVETRKPGLAMVLIRLNGLEELIKNQGRSAGRQIQQKMAEEVIGSVSRDSTPSRMDEGVFAWLEPGLTADEAALKASAMLDSQKLLSDPIFVRNKITLSGGAAAYPHNFNLSVDYLDDENGELNARELEELASIALMRSEENEGKIISLDDVRRKLGCVVEILPMNRVVIDLGSQIGIIEGDRFYVAHHSEAATDVYKAELQILSVEQDRAVGEITALMDERFPVEIGNRLELVEDENIKLTAADERVIDIGENKVKVHIDKSTGLPNSRSIKSIAESLAESEDHFSLMIVRLEGLLKKRSLLGQKEADNLLERVTDIASTIEKSIIPIRIGVESIGLFLPGIKGSDAVEIGNKIYEKSTSEAEQELLIGISEHPFMDYPLEELKERAFKALDHASFPEIEPVIIFNSVSLVVSGDRLYHRGDINGAVEEYERALALDPDNTFVLNSLGACYGQLDRFDEAIKLFERGAEIAADDFMAWYNLGMIHRKIGRKEDAVEAMTKAYGMNKDHFAVLFALGQLCLDRGQNQAAVEWFTKASKTKGVKQLIHRWLAESLVKTGKEAEAMVEFKAAVKANPEDAASLSWLGRLYMDGKRDYEVALSLTRQAVDIEPKNSLYRERYGRALVNSGKMAEAMEQFKSILSNGTKTQEVLWGMGLVLESQNKLEQALESLTEALELGPENEGLEQDIKRIAEILDGEEFE